MIVGVVIPDPRPMGTSVSLEARLRLARTRRRKPRGARDRSRGWVGDVERGHHDRADASSPAAKARRIDHVKSRLVRERPPRIHGRTSSATVIAVVTTSLITSAVDPVAQLDTSDVEGGIHVRRDQHEAKHHEEDARPYRIHHDQRQRHAQRDRQDDQGDARAGAQVLLEDIARTIPRRILSRRRRTLRRGRTMSVAVTSAILSRKASGTRRTDPKPTPPSVVVRPEILENVTELLPSADASPCGPSGPVRRARRFQSTRDRQPPGYGDRPCGSSPTPSNQPPGGFPPSPPAEGGGSCPRPDRGDPPPVPPPRRGFLGGAVLSRSCVAQRPRASAWPPRTRANGRTDHRSIEIDFTVACSPEHAFDVWADRTTLWWPVEHTVSAEPDVAVSIEPRVGGRSSSGRPPARSTPG